MPHTAMGILTLLVGVALSTLAPRGAGAAEVDDKAAAQKELEKLEADWAAAVESNDADRIARFFTDDFLFVGAGGVRQDRKQHLEDFRSGRLKVESVKIEDKTVHVYDRAAVVSTRVAVKGTFGKRDISGPYQFTDTWVRQGDRWLAAARQQTQVRGPSSKKP